MPEPLEPRILPRKKCNRCGRLKSTACFSHDPRAKGGHAHTCGDCSGKRNKTTKGQMLRFK